MQDAVVQLWTVTNPVPSLVINSVNVNLIAAAPLGAIIHAKFSFKDWAVPAIFLPTVPAWQRSVQGVVAEQRGSLVPVHSDVVFEKLASHPVDGLDDPDNQVILITPVSDLMVGGRDKPEN